MDAHATKLKIDTKCASELKWHTNKKDTDAYTNTGVEVALHDVYAICYEGNVHNVLATVYASTMYDKKKNKTKHIPTCFNQSNLNKCRTNHTTDANF